MPRRVSETSELRAQLNKALRKGQVLQALDLYRLIEMRKPDEPRWPHRRGDLLLRLGRKPEAAEAYARAVTLYIEQGFDARAAATAKIMLAVDPSRTPPPRHTGLDHQSSGRPGSVTRARTSASDRRPRRH